MGIEAAQRPRAANIAQNLCLVAALAQIAQVLIFSEEITIVAEDFGEVSHRLAYDWGFAAGFAAAYLLSALGLRLLSSWGWIVALLTQVLAVLMNAKILGAYLLQLQWEHENANSTLQSLLGAYGTAIALALCTSIFLLLPSLRLACGIKEEPFKQRPKSLSRSR